MENTPAKKRFDWDKLLAESLDYAQHGRLMLLLLCLGVMAGICYFVFSTPIYMSTSTMKVRLFGIPIASDTGSEVATPTYMIKRQLVDRFNSATFKKQVAVKQGWASEETTAEAVRQFVVPFVRFQWLDGETLQVAVMSRFKPVVRQYVDAMVKEFQTTEAARRAEFREQGIARYMAELDDLKTQIDTEVSERYEFEKERDLTNLFIEQRNLTEVPRELVLAKSRIEQLDNGLSRLTEAGSGGDITEQLALLTTLEEEGLELKDIAKFTRRNTGDSPLLDTVAPVSETEVVVAPVVLEDWKNWERERRQLSEQLKEKSEIFLPDHPVIQDLTSNISDLTQRLELDYSVRLKRLQVEREDLEGRRDKLQAKMPDYEKVTREYERFRRDYSLLNKSELAWDKMFESLSQKVAALEYGANKDRLEIGSLGFVSLRDENPVSPNKSKLVMISAALGLGMAVGLPFLLNLTNTSTSKISDLESLSGLQGIGVVPLTDKNFLEEIVRSPMLGATVPNALLENFRLIRSNICLHPNRKGDAQVVMVTSARPGEGKSTQAANLAWAFFSMGERTLLIDCDLRRGRQHHLTHVENAPGLTGLLTQQAELKDVILKTENDNLDVIPRGPVIAGTTEVLCQTYFDDVIAELRKHYHRIVIDTPPVLGLSETSSLQRITDGVSLVVRADVTPQRDTLDAIDKLRKAGAHIFGFVLNGMDLDKMANRYHYYYYSANYYDSFDPPEEFTGDNISLGASPSLRRKHAAEYASPAPEKKRRLKRGLMGSADTENTGA
jgi:capsular exopolysaccharide synthesis family protein